MEIRRVNHLEGARTARGVAVAIDVLRAFTTAAYAFAAGAADLVLAADIEEARELKRRFPDAFAMGEEGGIRIDGFDHGNSPSDFPSAAVRGRRIIQRTGSGTRAASAAGANAEGLYLASLVVAGATVRALRGAPLVTIVASAGDLEGDDAVGDWIEGQLRGSPPPIEDIVRRIRGSRAGLRIASGEYPQYPPADLECAVELDRFDFAMKVSRRDGLLVAMRA